MDSQIRRLCIMLSDFGCGTKRAPPHARLKRSKAQMLNDDLSERKREARCEKNPFCLRKAQHKKRCLLLRWFPFKKVPLSHLEKFARPTSDGRSFVLEKKWKILFAMKESGSGVSSARKRNLVSVEDSGENA